jgi:hypothetical protein
MDLVFKVTAGSPSTPPQLGDTNFLAHYTGANRSMAWAEVSPGVRQATEKFVLPFIGTELYDDLAAMFQADDVLTTEQAKALELLQDCIAYYTTYHILPERNAFLSTVGVTQNTPTEGSASPTSQWAWKMKRWNALENADTFLDKLLAYLEQQVAAEVAYFDLWKDSAAYNVRKSDFFRGTGDMDEFLNIQGSRRSYISLVKYLREVEEDVILPLLCTDQYNALLEADLDADAQALKAKVSKAVAYLGLNAAIPHHRIVIDGDGFRVVSQTDQFDERRNQTNNIHEAAIIALATTAEQRGRRYLLELENFLRENADTYTLWRDSSCNTTPTKRGHSVVISPDRVGGVGLF